jgi:serine/threonine protein kinase
MPVARGRASTKPQREITIDDFVIVDKLGKGAFGEVYLAMEKQLGLMCVLKKMSKKRIREAKVEEHIIR